VDDQLHVLDGGHDHDLQEVAGPVRSDDKPAIGIFSGIFDGEGTIDGVKHVLLADAVLSRRAMELHTPLVYYEIRVANGDVR